MLDRITKVSAGFIRAGGSVMGVRHGTEEPAHSIDRLAGRVEIRRYGERVAAETTVTAGEEAARDAGFRLLAGYIFGGNHAATVIPITLPAAQQGIRRGQKIAMTAPVSQTAGAEGQWVIRFFMPAGETMQSLPRPDHPAVRLVTVPAETVAVRRFSGSRGHRSVASQTAQLMSTLREFGFQLAGIPAAWFYDPPWTVPMLRRNEIAVPVESQP